MMTGLATLETLCRGNFMALGSGNIPRVFFMMVIGRTMKSQDRGSLSLRKNLSMKGALKIARCMERARLKHRMGRNTQVDLRITNSQVKALFTTAMALAIKVCSFLGRRMDWESILSRMAVFTREQ